MKKEGTEVLKGSDLKDAAKPIHVIPGPIEATGADLDANTGTGGTGGTEDPEDAEEDRQEDREASPNGDLPPYSESDSEMGLVEGEELPQGPGRPRQPPRDGHIRKPLPVTRPHFRVYTSEALSPSKKSKAAYNYWNKLTEWERSFIVCYVYRDHPILLDPPIDPDTKKPKDYKYIDKIDGTSALKDDADLLNRYGCGSYRLILTELAQSTTTKSITRESGQLCEIQVRNLGGGDYRSNPPQDRRVNDISQLDVSNPGNSSYVGYLRFKGIVPEEINKQKEDEEMAQVSIIAEQGKTLEKMADKMIEMAEAKNATPQAQALSREDVRGIVADSIRGVVSELRTTMQPPVPQKDPMELALQLVTLMNGTREAGGQEVAELRQQLANSNTQQMNMLMEQIKALSSARTEQISANATPFSGVHEGIGALKSMKEALEELGINVGSQTEEAAATTIPGAPKWLATLQPFLPMVTQIGLGLVNMLGQRLAPQSQTQQQQPQPQPFNPNPNPYPNAGMGIVPSLPSPGPQPMGVNAAGQYVPITPQQQQPQPVPGTSITGSAELDQLLAQIAFPLQNHLQDAEATGTEFASWFSSGYGDALYEQIVSAGPENILGMLSTHPATAAAIATVTPERTQALVTEFCSPKWDSDGEEEEGEDDGISAGKEKNGKVPA